MLGQVYRRARDRAYAPTADVLIGQHHWPIWGKARLLDYLDAQRDLYKHIHDQTLRLMNNGWRPAEIAEAIELPPGLAERWRCAATTARSATT